MIIIRKNKTSKKNKRKKILVILWERKFYYSFLFIILIFWGFLNELLGLEVNFDVLISVGIPSSILSGFLIYKFIKEPEETRKLGRNLLFTKETLIHIFLSFLIFVILST